MASASSRITESSRGGGMADVAIPWRTGFSGRSGIASSWHRLLLAMTLVLSAAATAQTQRPVRVLVPSTPAGPSDTQARLLAPRMMEALGQTLIVDNRPSNNGVFASELCARANPDGYTVCVGNSG